VKKEVEKEIEHENKKAQADFSKAKRLGWNS